MYQLYNQSIELFPALELKPLTKSVSRKEAVDAMLAFLKTIYEKYVLTTNISRIIDIDYSSLQTHEQMETSELEAMFYNIYVILNLQYGHPRPEHVVQATQTYAWNNVNNNPYQELFQQYSRLEHIYIKFKD